MRKINFKSTEVTELAEKMQDECHKDVEAICSHNPKVDYRDCTQVWVFRKLAQLQLEIEKLKEHEQ